MAKSSEKISARKMRQKGKSIKKIADILKVSSSSVSLWCRDIQLTPKQIQALGKNSRDPYYGKKAEYIKRLVETKNKEIENLRQEGVVEVGKMNKREIFVAGIALYWGEGFRKDHQVGLASSSPFIARFFIYWLKECFGIDSTKLILRVTANSHFKSNIKSMENYWSLELNVPKEQFSKPFFQKTIWRKKYKNGDDYHGIIRIKVRKSIRLLRKIYGYIEGFSQNIRI